ncbi:MAG: hypothetical protein WD069_20640 [Planctomycetales bacterium]
MIRSLHRLAAWLGLTGYLLVSTAGPWLHDRVHDHSPALAPVGGAAAAEHSGHACCGHVPATCGHARSGVDRADGSHEPHPHHHPPLHDDDCFVCQVLAASRHVSAPVAVVVVSETIAPAALPPVSLPDAPAPALPAPRGPPCPAV